MSVVTFKFNDYEIESITIDEDGVIISSVPDRPDCIGDVVMSSGILDVGDYLQIDVGKEYIELPVPVASIIINPNEV